MSTSTEKKPEIDQIWFNNGMLQIQLYVPNYNVGDKIQFAGLEKLVSDAVQAHLKKLNYCNHCKALLNGQYYRSPKGQAGGMRFYYFKCAKCEHVDQKDHGYWELTGEYIDGVLVKNHI